MRRKSFQRPAADFFHRRITKIARTVEVNYLFFFHLPGLNWSLKDVKHTILSLQKQLIFNGGGKELKMHIFILALSKIPTSSKQNICLDQ